MEKRKNETIEREATRPTLAIVLIIVGVVALLVTSGVFSPGDIGQFFGNVGSSLGQFFGEFGRSIGEFFGTLGRSFAQLWPLVLILIGALLLFRRGTARS